MLIPTNQEFTCPERTCNELHYYKPTSAIQIDGLTVTRNLKIVAQKNVILHKYG